MVGCFLRVLRKYIYDLFNVFRRKWLNLLYPDFKKVEWCVSSSNDSVKEEVESQ